MVTYILVFADLALQFTAVWLAVRLMRISEKTTVWALITLAIAFLALHRGYTIYEWLSTGVPPTIAHDLICLSISGLVVTGLALTVNLFRRIKDSDEQLQQSEQKYRTIVETAHEGIGVLDAQNRITYVNPRMCEIFGYPVSEFLGRPVLDFMEGVEKENIGNLLAHNRSGAKEILEFGATRKDGSRFNAVVASSPILSPIGQYLGTVGMITDITERTRAEEALRKSERRLRLLTGQILSAQENERQKLSLELHEDLGQTLQGLKLQTSYIKQSLPEGYLWLGRECEEMLLNLQQIIERIRGLSGKLSPQSLDDLGLLAALRQLVDDFCRQYQSNCRMEFDEIDDLFAPPDRINIFRLFQEALSNIGKHARATDVTLAINRREDQVCFVFSDNGRGFQVEEVMSQPVELAGFGLYAMQERVEMLGGTLHIDSHPGQGTELRVTVPISPAAEKA